MNLTIGAGGTTGVETDTVAALAMRLADDCAQRLRQEIVALAEAGFALAGSACATVCLVKGELSPRELAGESLLGGTDGDALRAALDRLGYPADGWAAVSSCVRAPDGTWHEADPADLAWAVEVCEPGVVIAVDEAAGRAQRGAWEIDDASASVGEVLRVHGRRYLELGGFAAALDDAASKRVMWERLKLVPPLGMPY